VEITRPANHNELVKIRANGSNASPMRRFGGGDSRAWP
jgi:hypothetical protein